MSRKLNISYAWLLTPALVLLLNACSSDANYDFEASKNEMAAQALAKSAPEALFNPDPTAPVLPFPNNLFFVGSDDGTLNIPISDPEQRTLANPQFALNQQDGFSTTSPIVTQVSETLDPESLILGDTVRVFEVMTPTQTPELRSAITQIVEEITNPAALHVTEVDNQLILLPLIPLKPSTNYMVVLTNGIKDMQGDAMQGSLIYRLLQGDVTLNNPSLEGLRAIVGSHSQLLNTQISLNPVNVTLTWVFSTQSTREVLQATKNISSSAPLKLVDSGIATDNENIGLAGDAEIYVGAIDLPYYQTAVVVDDNSSTAFDALNSYWHNANQAVPGALDSDGKPDYTPVKTTDVKVPVIMTIPRSTTETPRTMPASGWPVSIFQHGITGNRSQMLAIADAMAQAGRAVIAIDMPMHGLVDPTSPLHASNNPFAPTERTFDIDVVAVDPATGQQTTGPDNLVDPSGTHFYNLANLANSRDNLRQAIADLFVLSASISAAEIEGVTLDGSNLNFVGHSLGAIVGATMLTFDTSFHSATLGMPGGGIARLLSNSENFGPVINSGLAANGVETGSAAYNQFLTAAQTMIDSGDPINHAAILADSDTRIHLIEVLGDKTIPNEVATAPLSGTEPLIRMIRLPAVDQTVTDTNAAVRFTAGDHGSIVRATASLAATVEMQTQMAGFAASQGTTLPVTDTSVLQATE